LSGTEGTETYCKTAFIRNRFVQRYLSVTRESTRPKRDTWEKLNRVLLWGRGRRSHRARRESVAAPGPYPPRGQRRSCPDVWCVSVGYWDHHTGM